MGQAHRFSGAGQPYEGLTAIRSGKVDWSGVARFVPDMLGAPLRWRNPRRVFVNSMSDLFHHSITDEQIAAVFGVMAACPQHTFQVLTKRPERALAWFAWVAGMAARCETLFPFDTAEWRTSHILSGSAHRVSPVRLPVRDIAWHLPNVWLGVSAENQEQADKRVPLLLQCPAAVRFVSAEPLIGSLDLRAWTLSEHGRRHIGAAPGISWVIVGGESGPGARPCDVAWVRSVVEQCKEAGVACFVKQLGAKPIAHDPKHQWFDGRDFHEGGLARLVLQDRKGGDPAEWPADLRVREFPEMVGK
jgi:protein gp37